MQCEDEDDEVKTFAKLNVINWLYTRVNVCCIHHYLAGCLPQHLFAFLRSLGIHSHHLKIERLSVQYISARQGSQAGLWPGTMDQIDT